MRASLPLLVGLALLLSPFPAAVAAADEDIDLGGIDEIRVSITRRDESLQDVAATISAFDGGSIRELNIEQLEDVVSLIPNAQIKDGGNGDISIRGISQSFTSQSPVAAHLNGIFQFSPVTYGDFYDIASIEVQRGPVGVKYGRNATAGAVNVSWAEPTAEWETFGDLTVGSYDRRQFRGGVNIPLLGEGDDRLNARLIVARELRDAELRNIAGTRRDGGTDSWTLRGTLAMRPDEDTVAHVRAYWNKDDEASGSIGIPLQDEGVPFVSDFDLQALGVHPFDPYDGLTRFKQSLLTSPSSVIYALTSTIALGACQPVPTPACVDPAISSLDDAIEYILVDGAPSLGLPGLIRNFSYFEDITIRGDRDRVIETNAFDVGDPSNEVWFVDFDVARSFHDVGPLGDLSLQLAGSHSRQNEEFFAEVDGTRLEIVNNFRSDEAENWVGELRLQSENDGPVNWTLGIFWFDRQLDRDDFTRVPFVQTGSTVTIQESGYAPFVNLTLRPLEWTPWADDLDLELFMGLRRNRDTFSQDTVALPTPLTAGGHNFVEDVFREVTYELGFRWFATEDQTVYLKYSTGYKAGFIEFDNPTDRPGRPNPVDEEVVRAWEAGWKANWDDNRLQTSWTAFYYDYTNLQVPKLAGFQVLTENAASATNWGVEFEGRWAPTDEWLVQLSAGYLDATFNTFCSQDDTDTRPVSASDPACAGSLDGATAAVQDLSGFRLEDSPRWSVALTSRYTFDLGEWGTITPVLAFSWTDSYFRRPFNLDTIDRVDAHTQTDLRLIWKSEDGHYSVEIFGENLEEEFYYGRTITVQLPYAAVGFGPIGRRIYGLRVGFHFGAD